ncbi:hypothetical protein FJZ31_01115 [Candidatus Poribacteria bacterium]|nr:hypothetical protein [Candidatus Poribacteria bacterium]
MRKKFWIAGLALLLVIGVSGIALSYCGSSAQQPVAPITMMGPGMMGPRWMMGRGYGTWGTPMMGPAMCPMRGYWADVISRGWAGNYYGTPFEQSAKPLTKEDATAIVKNYLASTRNPNIEIGDMKESDNFFKVEIVTKDGSLVDEILVDKRTGLISSAY